MFCDDLDMNGILYWYGGFLDIKAELERNKTGQTVDIIKSVFGGRRK